MNAFSLPIRTGRGNDDDSQAGGASATATIDTEALLKRCMGKVSFALMLLRELEASGMKHVERIDQHVAVADCAGAAMAAHALKGAASIIGAESLRSLAAEIEAVGNAGDLESIPALVNDLREQMRACLVQIPLIFEQAQENES
ncbi:MAG TPA: Hpt domain-containing protein [Pirellulaceae bacterium]|nr:Hpt domain-containing protein [Pirellulaceae bacterium]